MSGSVKLCDQRPDLMLARNGFSAVTFLLFGGGSWRIKSNSEGILREGWPTNRPESSHPLQHDAQDYLPSGRSLVATSNAQSLGVRLTPAVDEAAQRAEQKPKYADGRH